MPSGIPRLREDEARMQRRQRLPDDQARSEDLGAYARAPGSNNMVCIVRP